MQYENNLRKKIVLQREKTKTRFGFQKAFFQKVHLEKGGSSYNQGRLIFGSIRYYEVTFIIKLKVQLICPTIINA